MFDRIAAVVCIAICVVAGAWGFMVGERAGEKGRINDDDYADRKR